MILNDFVALPISMIERSVLHHWNTRISPAWRAILRRSLPRMLKNLNIESSGRKTFYNLHRTALLRVIGNLQGMLQDLNFSKERFKTLNIQIRKCVSDYGEGSSESPGRGDES